MRTFALLMLVTALAMSGCDADPCPGKETCGDGCMPTGADCCPNGSGYCDAGKYCGTDNMCHTSGGGGGGGNTCAANTCISNLCSPGLWCCPSGHSCNTGGCGCH